LLEENALPILVTDLGNITSTLTKELLKAAFPILVKVEGKLILFNEVHPLKALTPIVFNPSFKITLLRLVHCLKQSFGKLAIEEGISIDSIPELKNAY